jgi:hypothetical protein
MKISMSSIEGFLLVVVIICTFQARLISAQSDRISDLTALIKKHANWDPGEFILEKLKTNRIVMVADAGHGDPLYSRIIINTLNDWVSACERPTQEIQPEDLPSKLFLILEIQSAQANALRQYFQSGNSIEIIEPENFWGYQFTTGTLEFFDDLRTLRHRIDAFNRKRPTRAHITFDIFGPEKEIDLLNWTTQKRDSFYVYERDEYSSTKIKELLRRDPDAKALIFYGNAHLFGKKIQKLPSNKQSIGYFLAYYLKESFDSSGGVYTCGQVDVLTSSWLDQAFSKINNTFAINNSTFNGIAIDPDATFPAEEGTVYHFAKSRHSRHLSMLFSENLVKYIMDNIDKYRDGSKEFYRGNLDTWFYYLSNVAVTMWHPLDYRNQAAIDSAINAWKMWQSSTKLNIVEDLSSLKYFKRSVDRIRMSNDQQSMQYQLRLSQIVGFKIWFQNGTSQSIYADSVWNEINKYRKSIVVENLIDLLWVASKSEKEKAIFVLNKETGMNFNTAKEWTSWWDTQQIK